MGAPLGPKYILYSYMDPLGLFLVPTLGTLDCEGRPSDISASAKVMPCVQSSQHRHGPF